MASDPDSLALTAPLTGTLQYPFAHLMDLGRLILFDYQSHLQALEDATVIPDDDDEDVFWVWDYLCDVEDITWLLDRGRWMKENEAKKARAHSEFAGHSGKVEAVEDPKQAEKLLLTMGKNYKAEFVISAAIKLRREKRRDPPEGGWENENASLDLLEFISKNNHSGLFRAMED